MHTNVSPSKNLLNSSAKFQSFQIASTLHQLVRGCYEIMQRLIPNYIMRVIFDSASMVTLPIYVIIYTII